MIHLFPDHATTHGFVFGVSTFKWQGIDLSHASRSAIASARSR
jgi:hypothetical protein